MTKTTSIIYRAGGPLDKVIQLRMSELHEALTKFLVNKADVGEVVVPHAWQTAADFMPEVERISKTIATITLEP